MSKIEKLKQKYPHLNITLIDIFSRFDSSKTQKYLPLFCKVLGSQYTFEKRYDKSEIEKRIIEIRERFSKKNLNINNLSNDELLVIDYILQLFNMSDIELIQEFIDNCENKRLDNLDVLTYNTIDEVMRANSLCSLRLEEKNMEGQVIKEFEDDKWVIVRPLTFLSSAKYGAGTKWCTTMLDEKSYFHRYWRNGVLVYFINKETGYKFAAFKDLQDDDNFSFWSAEDKRTDFFSLEVDDYLFPIIRNIFKSDKTNKELCSIEISKKVDEECADGFIKFSEEVDIPRALNILMPVENDTYNVTTTYDGNINLDYTLTVENPPIMRA